MKIRGAKIENCNSFFLSVEIFCPDEHADNSIEFPENSKEGPKLYKKEEMAELFLVGAARSQEHVHIRIGRRNEGRNRGRKGDQPRTSNGDVGEAVRAPDVDGVGEDPEERLGDERQVPGVLRELQRGGAEAESPGEVEVEGQPREAAEPLHPVADPAHPPHPAHLPQPPAPLRRGRREAPRRRSGHRGRGRRGLRRLERRRGAGDGGVVVELGDAAPLPPPLLEGRRRPEA